MTEAVTSTNESGEIDFATSAELAFGARDRLFLVGSPPPMRHFHHDSERQLIPDSAANSFALSPLAFHRSTCWTHTARTASIATSAAKNYADCDLRSGTRFVERIRTRRVSRRIAKPLSQQASGLDPYASHWYRQGTAYDFADRVSARTTGVEDADLLAGGAGREVYTYSPRGLVSGVYSAARIIISGITYTPEGLLDEVTYGDLAATKAKRTYDPERLRLATYKVSRSAPGLWFTSNGSYSAPPPETRQTTLAQLDYHYDLVGNPDVINDLAPSSTGGLAPSVYPVRRRTITVDDFYRVTRVDYGYGTPTGSATFTNPFLPEINAGDTRPAARASLPSRVTWQTFDYDFMGNTTATDDNLSASYDRSLGTITNGDVSGWGPNQLSSAAANGVSARYDEAGNLVELKVERGGTCPSGAGSNCAQWYAYEWDEVGQLSRARRWDYASTLPIPSGDVPDEDASWDLHYAYSGGVRVLKTAKDALGVERHTLEVFDTLRLEHDHYIPASDDYERNRAATHVYLAGGAGHMFYDDSLQTPPLAPPNPNARMYLNIGDHLGSTSVVIDHASSEMVERATFTAFGALESDHRPARWAHAREPYKFTGKEEDIEVGATYFGARYYNAHLGRFMSADPLTIHGLTGDMNPYAYVRGRIASHVDPFGLQDTQVQAAVEAAQLAALTPPPGIPGAGGTITGVQVYGPEPGNPFADVYTGSGIGGPMLSPDTAGIGGLERLDRGGPSSPAPVADARALFGIPPEVADMRNSDGRIDPDMQRGNDIAAQLIGGALAAVVVAYGASELIPVSAPALGPTMTSGLGRGVLWQLGNAVRGAFVERLLRGNLPDKFPTIDRWINGQASSIKTLDLATKTYQNPAALTSRVSGMISAVQNFNGASFDGVTIKQAEITSRTLELVIPSGGSPAQQTVLKAMVDLGKASGVTLNITIVQ